jgi:hypothetical protein
MLCIYGTVCVLYDSALLYEYSNSHSAYMLYTVMLCVCIHVQEIEMESHFCSVSLDIIGKSIFNYDFGSVTNESPVIKVRTLLNSTRSICYSTWYTSVHN